MGTVKASKSLAPIALVAALIGVVLLVVTSGGGGSHVIRAQFASAEQLAPGLEVRIAGRTVGSISSVNLVDGRAVVTMSIGESDVWPLPVGTTATARWGSTTSLEYDYIELVPGPLGGASIPNNGLIPESHTQSAVQLDTFYRIFRGKTTPQTSALVHELGNTLAGQGPALRSGLAAAPGGLDQTESVLNELGSDQQALNELVTQGDDVTSALASRQDDLGALVDHAAATFNELGDYATQQQEALDIAPQTMTEGAGTLSRLDGSLNGLQTLVNDLAPGAIELRTLAPTARDALSELSAVAPLADTALRNGTSAAAPLDRLLTHGTSFLPQLSSVAGGLAPMVDCILPYGPEIAGALSTWSGFNENYDSGGHYARTFDLTANPLIIAGSSLTSAEIVAASNGGLMYAMPRPPGMNAGQPVLLPQCGAGANALNADDDPESGSS